MKTETTVDANENLSAQLDVTAFGQSFDEVDDGFEFDLAAQIAAMKNKEGVELSPVEAMREIQKIIKPIVRGAYDMQTLRVQMGNRLSAIFRERLGIAPGTKKEDAEKESRTILDELEREHKLITATLAGMSAAKRKQHFPGESLITSQAELTLVDGWIALMKSELAQFKSLEKCLVAHPVYPWLKSVPGVGPAMAGIILSEIDIERAQYPSSLWAYAGIDVASDGRGRSRKTEHLVERTYIDKNGKEATRTGITFNPLLKTKLVGVLGSSFLKQSAAKCEYRAIYDGYKHRLETSPEFQQKQAVMEAAAKEKGQKYAAVGHRHNMAMRYAIKRFLVDLYREWRTVAELPVAPPYSEAKLGLTHGSAEKYRRDAA